MKNPRRTLKTKRQRFPKSPRPPRPRSTLRPNRRDESRNNREQTAEMIGSEFGDPVGCLTNGPLLKCAKNQNGLLTSS